MPVANYETYCEMLDSARRGGYAFPAINVVSMESASAALEGFAAAKSDGIIQVSIGGAKHASGQGVGKTAVGAVALANYVHYVADHYGVYVALHTDHCPQDKLGEYVRPLIAETARRRAAGLPNLFQSHMFDGGTLPMEENIRVAAELAALCAENDVLLEVEAGVVGGEEDGVCHDDQPREKLFTTPEDMLAFYDALAPVAGERFLLAATFGNVHGAYKPGNVQLKPKILREGQAALRRLRGEDKCFYLVFHGGSGSTPEEIAEAVSYGVVKMNVDTDTQYAFTRPVAHHILRNYDSVLKIDGEVGSKKQYDPRAYLAAGELGMKARVAQACDDLGSTGRTIFGGCL
jgi:fructose-bisphosphate aldolase class II